jgi:pimeloyl-ACP methyl ester carboxylesterase
MTFFPSALSARLAGLLAAGLVTACTARPDPALPDPAAPAGTSEAVTIPQDQFARVNGVTLHYLDWGGTGDLLLMIPGWSHTAHTWDGIAPSFTNRFHVMGVTRRGHGASEKVDTGFTIEALVQDIVSFVDAVGARRVVLVGSSFAGREMPLAARKLGSRAAGIVFVDAVYDWPALGAAMAATAEVTKLLVPPDSAFRSREALETWFRASDPSTWNQAQQATLRSQTLLLPDGRVGWQLPESFGRHLASIRDRAAEFSAIAVPTLVLWANQGEPVARSLLAAGHSSAQADAFRKWAAEVDVPIKRAGIAAVLRAVPAATIVEMNAKHVIHWSDPAAVVRHMNEFLDKLVAKD